MARRVSASRIVRAPGSVVERVWLDPARWASWVDGFGHVVRLDEGWPAPGSTLVWESPPGGRGRVVERVLEREPGVSLMLAVEDSQLTGAQEFSFAAAGQGGVRVSLALEYLLKRRGPLRAVVDALFIGRAMVDAQRRTLARFEIEVAAEVEG